MSVQFAGIYPAVPTALNRRGELELGAQAEIVEWLLSCRVHGIFGVGSQGESFALSFEERSKLTRTYVDTVRKRVPVMIGTGAVTTAETVALSRDAEANGADALSVITPYFVKLVCHEKHDPNVRSGGERVVHYGDEWSFWPEPTAWHRSPPFDPDCGPECRTRATDRRHLVPAIDCGATRTYDCPS